MAAIGSLGTAMALAAPLSASAANSPSSFASGQFLSGSIGGVSLAKLAAIQAASATNSGGSSMQVSRDPLGVSALGATLINQPNGVQLNLGQIIDLGAVNQYAQAANTGNSMASSGAVNNDGGIGVGTVGGPVEGSTVVDLDSLLGAKFASVISDLKLQTSDVAAQAVGRATTASGNYTLADLKLNLTSPAIAGLSGRVAAALAPLNAQLAALDGPTGDLSDAVSNVVSGLNPILNLAGANASVNAGVAVDLNGAVAPLLTGDYTTDGVTVNLQTGTVSVDLAKLLGGKINSEPAGTEVLSDAVVNQVLKGVTSTIDSLLDQVDAKVNTALNGAAVNVDAVVNASTAQAPLLGQSCVQGSTGTSGTGGLLGGLLGGTGSLNLGGLLCTPTSTLLPSLATNLAVHVHGTVGQLANGTAPTATAALTLLGVPVAVNLNGITSGIDTQLTNHLLTGTTGLPGVATQLDNQVLAPAVTGLLGSGNSVGTALTKVLSVKLNNQSVATTSTGSTFTETALKVSALPDGANSAATVNLASASVGPNAATIVPSNPTDPSDPSSPTSPADPSNPTTPGAPTTPGGPGTTTTAASVLGNLAFTGVGIAPLVSAILALLAAGAYLVREGYRRNGRRQIS